MNWLGLALVILVLALAAACTPQVKIVTIGPDYQTIKETIATADTVYLYSPALR